MSKTLTTSVAFTDPQGNVLANGVIIFQLNMGAKLITNGEVVNVLKISFTLTSTGLMPAASTIIANDELMPTGTMYVVTIFNSNGLLVRGPENWILSGTSPIDISTITSSSIPDPGLANPIIGNPSAPQSITGQSLTLTASAPFITQGSGAHSGVETFCQKDGMFTAGSSCYATIQSAITAAVAAGGSVLIPATYAGADSYTNATGVAVDDRRIGNGANESRLWSVLAPSFPTTAPLGNDLVTRARGPADKYDEHLKAATTSGALNVGANASVLIGAVTVSNTSRGTLQTGTTALFYTVAALLVGAGTANAETVPSGSWSVVDGTHLSITCANNHAGTVDIEQLGSTYFYTRTVIFDPVVLQPAQQATAQITFQGHIGAWFTAPGSTSDTWPLGGLQWNVLQTGGNSATKDLRYRSNLATSSFIWGNATNNNNLMVLQESGGAAVFKLGNDTNNSFQLTALSDLPRFYGGGTSNGAIFYGTQGGTGTSGIFRFRNNGTDNTEQAFIDTSQGNVSLNGVIKNTAATATMGLTLKKGSGAGNYTTASTTYVVADSTNLCFTVTIPTGWKLGVSASGALGTATGAVLANIALTDNAACSTANAGILVESTETATGAGVLEPFALNWVITGDGAAHNVALQYKTSNGADSATLLNASATQLPTMVFMLMPSN